MARARRNSRSVPARGTGRTRYGRQMRKGGRPRKMRRGGRKRFQEGGHAHNVPHGHNHAWSGAVTEGATAHDHSLYDHFHDAPSFGGGPTSGLQSYPQWTHSNTATMTHTIDGMQQPGAIVGGAHFTEVNPDGSTAQAGDHLHAGAHSHGGGTNGNQMMSHPPYRHRMRRAQPIEREPRPNYQMQKGGNVRKRQRGGNAMRAQSSMRDPGGGTGTCGGRCSYGGVIYTDRCSGYPNCTCYGADWSACISRHGPSPRPGIPLSTYQEGGQIGNGNGSRGGLCLYGTKTRWSGKILMRGDTPYGVGNDGVMAGDSERLGTCNGY